MTSQSPKLNQWLIKFKEIREKEVYVDGDNSEQAMQKAVWDYRKGNISLDLEDVSEVHIDNVD